MEYCEVKTNNGIVKGKIEDGICKWFGIPYAKKPLGENRFRRAQPVQSWSGVLETVELPNKPIQPAFFVQNDAIAQSEDCLYLNIMSKETEGKKPVLVWIYGGAFIVGEATLPMYDGTAFANDDIVFVSINYRVAVYGGYDLSHFVEGERNFDGNIFISDQIQALRWVKDNIQYFGGDSENITIMGESAGGTSVMNLLASPSTEGLFQKVICESGVIGATVPPQVGNLNMRWLLRHLRVNEDELYKIKEMDEATLSEAAIWLLSKFTRTYPGLFLAGPVTGPLLPEVPLEAIKKGQGKGVKLLIGVNKDESTLFVTDDNSNMCYTEEEAERFLDNCQVPEEVREELRAAYGGDYGNGQGLKDFMSDINFTYYSQKAAEYQSQFEDTYMYYYKFANPVAQQAQLGCYHSSEIPFVFDTCDKYDMKEMLAATSKETLDYFTKLFHENWVNFIKYGNPNGNEEKEPWEKFDADKKNMYVIDETCKMENDPFKARVDAVDKINIYDEF